MNKILLEIIVLTQSLAQNQSYTIVLGEMKGNRRLPIVIGNTEAKAIAVAMENMSPPRPLTHDLMKNILDSFDVIIKEIIIYHLMDGIFYSKIVCIKDQEEISIDSRPSDAIALAVRFGCPIYTNTNIMESAGIYLDESAADENEDTNEDAETNILQPDEQLQSGFSILTNHELEKELDDALNDEDYERAARVRDELNKRRRDSL